MYSAFFFANEPLSFQIIMAKSMGSLSVQPSLFDMFFEEFLSQFMASADPAEISQEFLQFRTDLERIGLCLLSMDPDLTHPSEFLMKLPFVDEFEIQTKAGVKCSEKAVR